MASPAVPVFMKQAQVLLNSAEKCGSSKADMGELSASMTLKIIAGIEVGSAM